MEGMALRGGVMPNKIPAWTASSMDAFTSCPYTYYRLRVAKDVKDLPRSESALWGSKVHKIFEDHINWGDPLPAEFKKWEKLAEKIKAMPGEKLPEFRFSIDEAYRECPWKEAWCRGAADLVIRNGSTAVIIDYKTGKRKPSDQLSLYAAFAFAYWPEVTTVHTAYVWLKDQKIDRNTYTREDIPKIWEIWLPLVARMNRAYDTGSWPARPSGLCRGWCPVTECQFCGE